MISPTVSSATSSVHIMSHNSKLTLVSVMNEIKYTVARTWRRRNKELTNVCIPPLNVDREREPSGELTVGKTTQQAVRHIRRK